MRETEMKQRNKMRETEIKHNRNKPVAEHFNKPDHTLDNLKLAVIKEVKGKTKQQREVEEQKIIFKLDCVNQDLNKDYSFMSRRRRRRRRRRTLTACPIHRAPHGARGLTVLNDEIRCWLNDITASI